MADRATAMPTRSPGRPHGTICGCGSSAPRRSKPTPARHPFRCWRTRRLFRDCRRFCAMAPAPMAAGAIGNRAYHASIADFLPADYRHLCELFLGSAQADQLQFDKIHRFAPKLNAHQLRNACLWHRDRARLETAEFIEYLRDQELASNVALGEVAAVALDDLKGIDDIIQQLEANIALPLENDKLANELGLKPKRGVLLVGPPGTGKTTVGRALA